MSNPVHLAMLKEGVPTWNAWREGAPRAECDLKGADLNGHNLVGANLANVWLQDSSLWGADLSGARVHAANLERTNLRGVNLSRADASSTLFSFADLRDANCADADLSAATLYQANLTGCRFDRASLKNSNLRGANLTGASFDRTSFERALVGLTIWANVDLSGAIGLEYTKHSEPSTIGLDTIVKSAGRIPEAFLRGCGVPDEFISYSLSFGAKPIEFHSCFISYSSRDHDFADQLYKDLQNAGVRCWFAPEDLKVGDKFRQHIDESIRLYDKLLIVLSERSIDSAWVEKEVETAFEEERRRRTTILFPVRLDDSIMNTTVAWASDIRTTRHIGDFRRWRDSQAYQRGFERLLKDLRSDSVAPSRSD